MKIRCRLCGDTLKGAQGAMPHLRMKHKLGEYDKLDQHRDKFEPADSKFTSALVPVEEAPPTLIPLPNVRLFTDGNGGIYAVEKLR